MDNCDLDEWEHRQDWQDLFVCSFFKLESKLAMSANLPKLLEMMEMVFVLNNLQKSSDNLPNEVHYDLSFSFDLVFTNSWWKYWAFLLKVNQPLRSTVGCKSKSMSFKIMNVFLQGFY